MLTGSVGGDLEPLLAKLDELQRLDMGILARTIAAIVEEDNRAGLLAGTDADGNPMAPLADSTARDRRRGGGPPTVPRFDASGLIREFKVRVEYDGSLSRGRIIGGYGGRVPQVKYFASGTRFMPRRNPIGLRPATRAKIQAALDDFARQQLERFG